MSEAIDFFGEPISTYTRADAIADGMLADVSDTEGGKLFKVPVALTAALYDALTRGGGKCADTLAARIWDVCYMGRLAGSQTDAHRIGYRVLVGNRNLRPVIDIGPGDHMEPVITIGYAEDF